MSIKDRKEGRYIKTLIPYIKIMSYIMPSRNDSMNMFGDSIEVTAASRFVNEKRKEGCKNIGLMHVLIASYVRAISQVPSLNRFTNGKRVYSRNNIEYVMTVKKEMRADATETSIKVVFEPTDTVTDVYNKMEAAVSAVKGDYESNGTDKAAAAFMKLPRWVLSFAVRVLRCLDYLGLLPQALLDVSPFHGSFILTSMASLGIKPIYHHLYNFGNLPVFISMGARRRQYELTRDGSTVERSYIDLAMVTDERITDGFSYAKGFKLMKKYMKEPQLLDVPPEKVYEDIP